MNQDPPPLPGCPCCGLHLETPRLILATTKLFRLLPFKYLVTNATRCPRCNANTNGAPNSQHLSGNAVDLKAISIPYHQLVIATLSIPEFSRGGIGLYPRRAILHADVRLQPASWARVFDKDQPVPEVWKQWLAPIPMPRVPCFLHPLSPAHTELSSQPQPDSSSAAPQPK